LFVLAFHRLRVSLLKTFSSGRNTKRGNLIERQRFTD
jgi:hypothetical protein